MLTYNISEQMKNEIETMRKNKIIMGDIPNKEKLIIKINENEIPLTTGDFWRMQQNNKFTKTWIDKNDFAKIIGITPTGEKFTAKRCDEDLNENERNIYYRRQEITEETINELFSDKAFYTDDTCITI